MRFSYSRVSCWENCPYSFKLRYLDKLETYPSFDPQNALYLGTALHTGIEKNYEAARESYVSHYPIIDDLQIHELIKLEHLIPKAKAAIPTGIYELEVSTDDFVGFIDLLVPTSEGHFDLYDFKYSNNVDHYLESGQLHVYKYFYEMTHPGHTIDNLYFVFVPKTMIRQKKTEDLYQFRQRLLATLDNMEVRVERVEYNFLKVMEYLTSVESIQFASEYPKCPSRLCDWCAYRDYCENGDTLELITKENNDMQLPKNERRDIATINKKTIWIYGAPFSGKTYLSNKFPDPLMLNTDGNIKFVDAPYISIKDEVTSRGRLEPLRKFAWVVFKETLEELEKKENTFKTIVVDLLEDLYEACRTYMLSKEKLNVDHESEAGYGKGYDIVRKEFLDVIKRLTNLDYENIILISHEDSSQSFVSRGGASVTTFRPNIQQKIASKIAGMVDMVARVVAKDDRNGNTTRTISFKADEHIFGGGRLNVKGEEIPLDYDSLMGVYNNANKNNK